MQLKLDKKQILDYFLSPINNLTNSCTLDLDAKGITTLTHNTETGNTIILYGVIETSTGLNKKDTKTINIPDVKRFKQMLDCVPGDEIELTVDSNSINYKSSGLNFKYHLWENGLGQTKLLNPDKINKLTFDSEFVLTSKKISEIIKASMVVPWPAETNKIYFYTKDDLVFGELTDRTTANLDSISFIISDEYEGKDLKDVLPIGLDIFRLFTGLKTQEMIVKINTELKVLLFELKEQNTTLKYLVSSLVK